MAVYYKWIKGCSTSASLTTGAWTYITWGNTVGTSMENSLPKIEVADGRDGTKTDLGYMLTSKSTNVTVAEDWKFKKNIYVNQIESYSTITPKLTITPKVEIKSSVSNALTVSGGATINGTANLKDITAQGNITTSGNIDATGYIKSTSLIQATGVLKSLDHCEAPYFNATSDIRAKENIQLADYCALDIIKNLSIYNFNYKNSQERVTGILAQDLLKVQPDELNLVSNINASGVEGDFMSIKNDKLLFVLMKAIQEQQKEIISLKSELEELKRIR